MQSKNSKEIHDQEIQRLQDQLKIFWEQRFSESNSHLSPITLKYNSNGSYTTRTKSYKEGCRQLNCSTLDRVVEIDPKRQIALVEPRVSMKKLLQSTLPYGLIPIVVPELKDITVGGAIMGMAAESASHRWGTFNDTCSALEFLIPDGTLMRVSPTDNSDLFYGIAGSYGSLGTLVLAEIKLVPAKDFVHLRYTIYKDPCEALEDLVRRSHSYDSPDFLDGMIFNKNLAVVIEGSLVYKSSLNKDLPRFSTKPLSSEFYYQHAQYIAENLLESQDSYEEIMCHRDYFFRYDLAAFWIGSYMFHLPLLKQLVFQGILKWTKSKSDGFSESEISRYHKILDPKSIFRTLFRPITNCKNLCKMLHKSEKWVKRRFMIQDYCIPESNAQSFLLQVLENPGIFPMWLLPIKGTNTSQVFAPHLLQNSEQKSHFINFGLYGIPTLSASVEQITKELEQTTRLKGGRKVLYSHSYYTRKEFWEIFDYDTYEKLRQKTLAHGFWHDIVDKVLSV